jgi:plastocyanin
MRGAGIALLAAVGGMLLSPASPLAGEPPGAPQAVLKDVAGAKVGKRLKLDSSESIAGAGAIVAHFWDLDGDGSFEKETGARPVVELTPRKAGPLTVQVRVLDAQGLTADAKLDLKVAKAEPKPQTKGTITDLAGTSTGQGQGAASARATPAGTLVPVKRARAAQPTAKPPTKASKSKPATVTAAASSSVTIKNFKFAPSTSSVHVGDTISWTNQDIAPHTATAKDGSWDTGTINKNKTGSHTFTKAGTFPYICSIHPSMKGTVTVLAAAGSGGSNSTGTSAGSSGSNGTGSTANPSSSSTSSSLPHTGFDIAVLVFIAMCLTGSGASLRRALR